MSIISAWSVSPGEWHFRVFSGGENVAESNMTLYLTCVTGS